MNNLTRNEEIGVKVVRTIFGTLHFGFMAAAELTRHTEATIVNKITDGKISYEENATHRLKSYYVKQEKIVQKFKETRAKNPFAHIQPITNTNTI